MVSVVLVVSSKYWNMVFFEKGGFQISSCGSRDSRGF